MIFDKNSDVFYSISIKFKYINSLSLQVLRKSDFI